MSIAIFGSNGQLGQCLIKALSRKGTIFKQYSSTEVDVTQLSQILKIENPSLIINAAAYTDVDKAEEDSENAFNVNEIGPKNIALYCREHKIPLIHISTDYVFSGLLNTHYVESDIVDPLSVYGKSKLAGELAIQKYCPKYLILRTSWVFSEFGSNFLKTMLNFSYKKQIDVINDLYSTPTDANELSEAILNLIPIFKKSDFQSKILHFAGPESMTWFDFASIIFDEALKSNSIVKSPKINPISFNVYPMKANRPLNSSLDSKNFFKVTNFCHAPIKKTIRRAIKNIHMQS
jgi:dTDP-4-dehydrorhamnose reductase